MEHRAVLDAGKRRKRMLTAEQDDRKIEERAGADQNTLVIGAYDNYDFMRGL